MGFCDYIKLESASPENGVKEGTMFQSKSLYAGGGEFTITADGKLVEHRFRYENDPAIPHSKGRSLRGKRIHVGDRVVDYHGDILLHGSRPDHSPTQLVVRFTHGRLE